MNQELAIYSYLHIGMTAHFLPVTQWPPRELIAVRNFFLGGAGLGWEEGPRGGRGQDGSTSLWSLHALLSFTLPGLMQAVGAFVVYFAVYAQEGFRPTALISLRVEWEKDYVNDLEDSYGQEWVRRSSAPPSCLAQPGAELSFTWMAFSGAEKVNTLSVGRAVGLWVPVA